MLGLLGQELGVVRRLGGQASLLHGEVDVVTKYGVVLAGQTLEGISGNAIGSQHGLEGFLLETGEIHERIVLGGHGESLLASAICPTWAREIVEQNIVQRKTSLVILISN